MRRPFFSPSCFGRTSVLIETTAGRVCLTTLRNAAELSLVTGARLFGSRRLGFRSGEESRRSDRQTQGCGQPQFSVHVSSVDVISGVGRGRRGTFTYTQIEIRTDGRVCIRIFRDQLALSAGKPRLQLRTMLRVARRLRRQYIHFMDHFGEAAATRRRIRLDVREAAIR